MEQYQLSKLHKRAAFLLILSLFVISPVMCAETDASIATAVATKTGVAQGADLQQKRTWRAEKAHDLAHWGDQLRSRINPLTDVLKNSKIVTDVKKRKQAIAWVQSINEEVFKIVEKLRTKKIPTIETIKESAVVISLYIDMLYDALIKQLPDEALSVAVVDRDAITKKLASVTTYVEATLKKGLDAQRTLGGAAIPDSVDPDMLDLCITEQFVVAIGQGLEHLGDLIHDYGITKINRAVRLIDKLGKKVLYNSYIPYVVVPAFFAGVGLMSLLLWSNKDRNNDPLLLGVVTGALSAAIHKFGGDMIMQAWGGTRAHVEEIQNRVSMAWKRMQGLPVKEKIGGFEMLKPEDCEGEEEPLIGLEIPFGRVMSSIESALNRMQAGEREPLKGIQRTFVFVAPAGMGKTFLMEQLKHRIAQLHQLGVDIAYENIQGEKLVFGDLMARIKEAQQKNIGLILWIDEMHLYKPMKDGNTPLLSQLLQTESINKSNAPIWIFTATNEPGRFDSALIRSGRFEVVNIYEPAFQDRVHLFDYYLRQQGMALPLPELKLFAAQTQQSSPATIRKVINVARASGKALTKELIQAQILQLVFKVVPGFELLHGKEQREIAAYQSGKLLVHVLNALEYSPSAHQQFFSGDRFALCTAAAVEKPIQELAGFVMEPVANNLNFNKGARRIFGKMFVYSGREDALGTHMRVHEKEFMISELLAGSCAQEMYLKDAVDDIRRDDFKLAFEYCLDIERNGVPLELMSKQDQQHCRTAALVRFTTSKERATTLINKHAQTCKAMIQFMLQVKESPHIAALDVLMLLESKAPSSEPKVDVTGKEEATFIPVTIGV